jgi:hypothetical protein
MLGLEEKLFEMQSGTIAEWQQFAVPPSTLKLSIDVSFISKFEEPSKMLMQTDVGPLAHASVDAVLAHLRSIATEPKLRQRRTDELAVTAIDRVAFVLAALCWLLVRHQRP